MKKIYTFLLITLLLFGCKNIHKKENEIIVGATPIPHAEILESIKPILKQEGYELKIIPYTDYVTPNIALQDGSIDANFFQHLPYLEKTNQDRGFDLISIGSIHIEPLSIYSNKIHNLNELKEKDTVAIPNDPSNLARALILLHHQGLITLKDPSNLNSTQQDIVKNPKKLVIKPLEAGLLAKILNDVTIAVINGNYALQAHLNNPIAQEGKESPYANILAIKKGNENLPKIKALINALQNEKTKHFILEKYQGVIIPVF